MFFKILFNFFIMTVRFQENALNVIIALFSLLFHINLSWSLFSVIWYIKNLCKHFSGGRLFNTFADDTLCFRQAEVIRYAHSHSIYNTAITYLKRYCLRVLPPIYAVLKLKWLLLTYNGCLYKYLVFIQSFWSKCFVNNRKYANYWIHV